MTTRVRGSSSTTFKTVADLKAATDIRVGDFVTVESYTATNNSGVMSGKIVAATTKAQVATELSLTTLALNSI